LAALGDQGRQIFCEKNHLRGPIGLAEGKMISQAAAAPFQPRNVSCQPKPRRDLPHDYWIEIFVRHPQTGVNHEAAQHVAAAPWRGADEYLDRLTGELRLVEKLTRHLCFRITHVSPAKLTRSN